MNDRFSGMTNDERVAEAARMRDIVIGKPKRIMRFFGGKYDSRATDTHEFVTGAEWGFADYPMLSEDMTEHRKRGGICAREELDTMPCVFGYVGPMWDGGGLRYETPEVYNALSM